MEDDLESSLFYSCMSSVQASEDDNNFHVNTTTANVNSDSGASQNIGSDDAAVDRKLDAGTGSSDDNLRDDHSATVAMIQSSTPLQHNNNNKSAPPISNNGDDDDEHSKVSGSDNTYSNNIYAPSSTPPQPPHLEDAPSNPPSSNSNSSWSVLSEKQQRPTVRSITFNRDRTCLILSTSVGVRVRTLQSLHLSLQSLDDNEMGHDESHDNNSSWIHDVPLPPDGATYAQLLHNTSLLAVVKPSSPRCCHLFNAKHPSSPISVLPLSAAVKRVELQRKVLVALTVDLRLHIFHMTNDGGIYGKALNPTLITTLNIFHPTDSARNVTRGLEGYNAGCYFDMSPNEDEPYLVCKSFNGTPGTVRVYDPTIVQTTISNNAGCSNTSLASGRSATSTASSWDKHDNLTTSSKKVKRRIQLLTTINAHDHSVTRMLIGGSGSSNGKKSEEQTTTTTYLATASQKGTTIRIFGLPQGDYLWEWHRGSRACQFYTLSWNGTGDRLASYGSSGTVHIFDWQKKKQPLDIPDHDEENDNIDFAKVHDDDQGPRKLVFDAKTHSPTPKPLLRRIGSSVKRRTIGISSTTPPSPPKHRSLCKLKYKQSASASPSPKARVQTLVLALLDRDESVQNDLAEIKEDRLVLCTIDGEMRQYSVTKRVELAQIEDVLVYK